MKAIRKTTNGKPPALIIPGYANSGPEHWQSHWERRDPSCERVQQRDWDTPVCADWVARLDDAVARKGGPVVLVAHSAGCAMAMHWAASAAASQLQRIGGALLVSPADPDGPHFPGDAKGFGPMPLRRLPFASIVVVGTDDPYVAPERAGQYAEAWGSRFVLLQAAGHVNAESGFGPWPEGFALLDSLRGVSSSR